MKQKLLLLCLFVSAGLFCASAEETTIVRKLNIEFNDGKTETVSYDRSTVKKITFTTDTLAPDPYEKAINGHVFIDMGMTVNGKKLWWAKVNVGATEGSPQEYGDFYAWGETEVKNYYDKSTYTYKGTEEILPSTADAATVKWGGSCRIPTKEEWEALVAFGTDCWVYNAPTASADVYCDGGYTVTSPTTKKSIFLPLTGYRRYEKQYYYGTTGCYWSSTKYSDSEAYIFAFMQDGYQLSHEYGYNGMAIRAVIEMDE